MNANVGTVDRALRLAVGLALIAVAVFSGAGIVSIGLWKFGAITVGAVMIATAALRICPLYTRPGIRTCRT